MRPAAAAVGGHLHHRQIDGPEGDPEIGDAVGARNRCRTHQGDRNAVGNERAGIVQKIVLEADHPAILRGRDFESVDLRALLGGADEVLDPVLDVLDRATEFHRRQRHQKLVGVEHHDLLAEAAADIGGDDADLVLIDAEHGGQAAPHRQCRLRTVPDRELAGRRLPAGRDGAAFQRRRRAALEPDLDPRDVFRLGERRVGIPGLDTESAGGVIRHVRVNARRIVLDRLLEIHLDRQGLVVDVDQADRVLGNVAVDRHHHRDALPGVEHVVAGKGALRLRVGEVGRRVSAAAMGHRARRCCRRYRP